MMKVKFTEKELIKIAEAAHIISWSVDLIEVIDFIDVLYEGSGFGIPEDLHEYISDQNEDYDDELLYKEWRRERRAFISEGGE